MKVLIVEQLNHFKVLENTFHLLKEHCSTTFYINTDKEKNLSHLFPSAKHTKIIKNPFHSVVYFLWVLFIGWRYDFINIATGPEHNHYSDSLNVILFYICCILYRNKVILTIKNSRSYLSTTPGIFSFIRSSAIKHIKRFTFETVTLKNVFSENNHSNSMLLGVSYDRYTDLGGEQTNNSIIFSQRKEVKVGLLGVLTDFRRNYKFIHQALQELNYEERKKLKFVTLGCTPGGSENQIIEEFERYGEIDYIEGWITAEQFDTRGMSCDILISTLRKEFEYGTYKGSGSFGDAVYLRKRIIIPDYVDPEGEFDTIGIYYRTKDDLINIFKNIEHHIDTEIPSKYFEKFTTRRVFGNLMKDLRLNQC